MDHSGKITQNRRAPDICNTQGLPYLCTMETDVQRLFMTEQGEGEPLLILHGLLGMSDNWALIARALAKQFRVIVPDLRNHGRSPHSPVNTYEAMTADIVALCTEKGFDRVNILGHSMGGKVAMTIAFLYPQLTGRLIVADMGPGAYNENSYHRDLISLMLSFDPGEASSRAEIDTWLSKKITDERIRMFLLKNITRDRQNKFAWKANLPVLQAQLPSILEEVVPGAYFTGKTLFIRGELSEYINSEQCDQIYQRFPSASVVTIPGAGHWLHADAPGPFTKHVLQFLNS